MKSYLIYFHILLLFASYTPAVADTDVEQENLGQLVRELELVRRVTENLKIKSPAHQDQRVHFRYDVLISKLNALEDGVRNHIKLQNAQPKNHWVLEDRPLAAGTTPPRGAHD